MEIPVYLHNNGRSPVQDFSPEEQLYRRCLKEHVSNGKLLPTNINLKTSPGIDFPDMSVNREKFCNDYNDVCVVLCESDSTWDEYGVAEFQVVNVPAEVLNEELLKNNPDFTWTWLVNHVPSECGKNYPHSEIRTYRDGVYNKNYSPSNGIKKWFRHALSLVSNVIKEPLK